MRQSIATACNFERMYSGVAFSISVFAESVADEPSWKRTPTLLLCTGKGILENYSQILRKGILRKIAENVVRNPAVDFLSDLNLFNEFCSFWRTMMTGLLLETVVNKVTLSY